MATKKRKKKNVKMRRQIRRTVAAILMIMAIVVAAIPVERYGSMKASTTSTPNLDLDLMYSDYISHYTSDFGNYYYYDDNQNKYKDFEEDRKKYSKVEYDQMGTDDYVTSTITNGVLEWRFIYKNYTVSGSSNVAGIIVGYNPSNVKGNNVEIANNAYKDTWVITPGFVSSFKDAISNEKYQFKATKSSDVATTYGSYPGSILMSENGVDPSYYSGDLDLTKGTDAGVYSNGKTTKDLYDKWYGSTTKFMISGLSGGLTDYAKDSSAYINWTNKIKSYNDKQVTLSDKVNACTTQEDFDMLAGEINDLNTEKDEITDLKIPSSEIPGSALLDMICERTRIRGNNIDISLSGFKLTEVEDRIHYESTDSTLLNSYVPRWKIQDESSSSYAEDVSNHGPTCTVDDNGYLVTGKLNLTGIGNSVFKGDKNIGSVTVGDAFTFIGNEAFKDCNITSIYMSYVSIIGNSAFENSQDLKTVSFVGEDVDSNLSGVKYIGANSFAGTGVDKISIPNSVVAIGPGAFAECPNLKEVAFNVTGDLTLWPFAFYDATKLDSYSFPENYTKTLTLGMGSFACQAGSNDSLEEFEFPYMSKIVNNNVKFEKTQDDFYGECKTKFGESTIGKDHEHEFLYNYILAGRKNLKHVTFSGQLGNNYGSNNTPLRIPDETLAFCSGLEYVTMGRCSYNGPECIGLTYDTPNIAADPSQGITADEDNDADKDGETLFQDVNTSSFYVEGPGFYSNGEESAPRVATWTAQTIKGDSVPYKYYSDKDETKVCMEVSLNNGQYIASFEVIDEDAKTAKLVAYNVRDKHSEAHVGKLVVGEEICGYAIVAVGEGCFANIADKVDELVIRDNSIESLAANAFQGVEALRKVTIGNSVKEIGESAFEGCKNLENVYFSTPLNVSEGSPKEEWAESLKVGENAFKTGSNFLTFHGPIHSGYEPFEYAMADNTTGSSRRNICYKTDAPKNLTVIRDNVTGLATLIDYPHYEEIDLQNTELIKELKEDYGMLPTDSYSIIEKWENATGVRSNTYYERDFGIVTEDEDSIVEATVFMNIPEGIESIDVKQFFENTSDNSVNFEYFNRYYEDDAQQYYIGKQDTYYDKTRNINRYLKAAQSIDYTNVKELYKTDSYTKDDESTANPRKAGLFSGYFSETQMQNATPKDIGLIGKNMNFASKNIKRELVETVETGNDHLLSMTLKSVKDLPEYAFNSCENLIQVDLGDALGTPDDAGKYPKTVVMPFRGCGAMNSVQFGGKSENEYYKYANGILYRVGNGDNGIEAGKLEIAEVLESRGSSELTGPYDISSTTIDENNDPLLKDVTSIAKSAFSYNKNVRTIDLSMTEVATIPNECFKGDKNLQFLTLPESLETIGEEAFKEHGDSYLHIYFDDPNVIIDTSAFDSDFKGAFHGEEWATSEHTKKSGIYNFANKNTNIDWEPSLNKYKVRLFDYDADLLAVVSVEEGKALTADGFDLVGLQNKLTRDGYTFTGWAWDKDGDLSTKGDTVTDQNEVLNNIKEDRVLVAQYEANSVVGDDQDHNLTVKNGIIVSTNTTTATIKGGAAVSATAYGPAAGYTFLYWASDEIAIPESQRYSVTVSFVMPNKDAKITAMYRDSSGNTTDDEGATDGKPGGGNSGGGSGGDTPGGGGSSGGDDDDEGKYKLTVNYGSGSGKYDAGKSVTITAYAPEASNKVFSHWSTTTSEVAFTSTTSATTTLIMPKKDVTVTANYKTKSSSDDDDDDDDDDDRWNKRHGSTSSTTTATANRTVNTGTNPGTTANTGTTNTATPDSGTRLDIQSNGISNKDVGNANVSGSTDNFVIKITDSAAAKAAVEAALIDKYGSLDGLAYFPMDISLYDTSGKNKVTDTDGLSVSITIPIPDELIQYGGNNLAGAVNAANKMEDLVARFTTIDGIGCITFTATHFSPYAIYVDTNNLVAGQTMDATPKTGDGIHPKWFLAMALACMSITLFIVSDRKKNVGMLQ